MENKRHGEDGDDEGISVVQIDEHELDRECVRLPSNYLKYAHILAEAKRDTDELNATLDYVKSDLGRRIRAEPEKFGLEKATEGSIKEATAVHKSYREADENYRKAHHRQEMAAAVINALEHKKRSLTLLVELLGMGLFAAPKVSQRGREAVESMTKRKVRHIREED